MAGRGVTIDQAQIDLVLSAVFGWIFAYVDELKDSADYEASRRLQAAAMAFFDKVTPGYLAEMIGTGNQTLED